MKTHHLFSLRTSWPSFCSDGWPPGRGRGQDGRRAKKSRDIGDIRPVFSSLRHCQGVKQKRLVKNSKAKTHKACYWVHIHWKLGTTGVLSRFSTDRHRVLMFPAPKAALTMSIESESAHPCFSHHSRNFQVHLYPCFCKARSSR